LLDFEINHLASNEQAGCVGLRNISFGVFTVDRNQPNLDTMSKLLASSIYDSTSTLRLHEYPLTLYCIPTHSINESRLYIL